jgi:hypothetical protein
MTANKIGNATCLHIIEEARPVVNLHSQVNNTSDDLAARIKTVWHPDRDHQHVVTVYFLTRQAAVRHLPKHVITVIGKIISLGRAVRVRSNSNGTISIRDAGLHLLRAGASGPLNLNQDQRTLYRRL